MNAEPMAHQEPTETDVGRVKWFLSTDDPGSARWVTKQPGYMACPAESWLDETVTVRRVLGLAAFYIACVAIPVVLALVFLG